MADNKQLNPKKPIPASGYDRLRNNLTSNFADGFPVGDFPKPDNRANINRGTITSRKDDKVQDVSIGLQDHDEAIMYYFNNVIKPSVVVDGNRVNVPIMYGAPERWKGVQRDGHFRDKEGKIQVPLIMFKRDEVTKRRDLGNKLDGNNPQLYYTFQEKYTKKNQYDNFSVLTNRKPIKEYHATVIPDYVNITYSCIIWTDYVAQMNKLIEAINYASDSYWGDEERFKFNAKIDTYTNTTEVSQGDNRSVKTSFGLNIQGYLVPDSLNKELKKQPSKRFSKAVVSFGVETESIPSYLQPKTREQIREETGVQNVQQAGIGVGYSTVMGQGQAVGGLPTTSSVSLLYDYHVNTDYLVTNNETTIGSLTGRRLIQWSDQSGTNRHLLHDDYSAFSTASQYGGATFENMPYRPALGKEVYNSNLGPMYPTSSGAFIFDDMGPYQGTSGLFSTPIKNLTEYTFFMCLYLGTDVSSSINTYTTPDGIFNPLISGLHTFSGSFADFQDFAAIRYQHSGSTYSPNNAQNGNEGIFIQNNTKGGLSPYSVFVSMSAAVRPAPLEKHILTVSVSGSGAIKVRKNGVQVFATGSSVLSGSKYTFHTVGAEHYQGIDLIGGQVSIAFPQQANLDGVVFDSAMTDSYMTDADMYAFEKVIASRNSLSI